MKNSKLTSQDKFKTQYLMAPDGTRFVVIPEETFNKIITDSSNIEDLIDIKAIEDAIDDGALQDTIPAEIVDRIFDTDEHPTKIFREWRGVTTAELAKQVGVSQAHISMLENKKREGTVTIYQKIANALDLDLELVIPSQY